MTARCGFCGRRVRHRRSEGISRAREGDMNLHKLVGGALIVLLPFAAQAKIQGAKAEITQGQELCVVATTAVEEGFTQAFIRQVNSRGYATRFVVASADCPVSMTYSAVYAMSGGYRRVLKTSTFYIKRDDALVGQVSY